jgi:hypothetical protein
MRNGWGGMKDYKVYVAVACIPIAFIIGTPYALLDIQTFSEQVFIEYNHYTQGHTGMEGNALRWYLQYTWLYEGFINVFALLGIIWGIFRKDKPLIILSSFTIIYFFFISSFQVRNDRTFLPLTPFLFIYASNNWFQWKEYGKKTWPKFGPLIGYLVIAASLGFQAYKTIEQSVQFVIPNSRETASTWIQSNLPAGSKIAIEPYAPFVEPTQFDVTGMGPIIEYEPEWYIQNGYDYLVFGAGMYMRFYREPDKYPDQVLNYNRFFNRFELVKSFNDGGYEVKIYQVFE